MTRSTLAWCWSSALLYLAFFVAGVFGRHPWKADEPYSFGIVWSMLSRGRWLVPDIAGEPFVEKPPLVYWLGALGARLLPGLPAHESSRLAVLFLVALIVTAVAWIAMRLAGESRRIAERLDAAGPGATRQPSAPAVIGLFAVALLVGTIGFSEHLHKLLADVGQLAGAAIGLAGLVHLSGPDARPSRSGALLGIGAAIAFLSKGLLVPGILGVTTLLMLALPGYRHRRTLKTLAVAAAWALPLILAWLLPFLLVDPVLFHEWWWKHNMGRFVGVVDLGGRDDPLPQRLLQIVAMGLPLTLVVPWLAWRRVWQARRPGGAGALPAPWRERLRRPDGYTATIAYLVAALMTLLLAGRLRDVYILPALLPFVLLALPALLLRPGRLSRGLRPVIQAVVAVALLAIWTVWAHLLATGHAGPSWLLPRALMRTLPERFALPFLPLSVIIALLALALWLIASRTAPARSALLAWCAGFAVLWVTAAQLWLPWIDAARSHAATFEKLLPYMAEARHCVATHYLGESERAMLDYASGGIPLVKSFLGHSAWGDTSRPNPEAAACDVYVVGYRSVFPLAHVDPACWTRRVTVARPGNHDEHFEVHQRRQAPDAGAAADACRIR